MIGPYLERACERVLGGSRAIVVEPNGRGAGGVQDRRARTALAVGRACGSPVEVRYGADGRPEADGMRISASHGAELTVVVTGSEQATCDVEPVVERTAQDWDGLLGPAPGALRDLLVAESGEPADVAGTRVWCAMECIRKNGDLTDALTLQSIDPGGWTVFAAGPVRIGTWLTTVNDRPTPVVFAVLRDK